MILTDVAIPKRARRTGWLQDDQAVAFTIVLSARMELPAAHSAPGPNPQLHPEPKPRKALKPKPGARSLASRSLAPQSLAPPSIAPLTHAQLRKRYGAAAHALEKIEAFARSFQLEITETAERRRSVRLSGRAADVGRAFHTRLAHYKCEGHPFVAPARPPRIPASWKGAVEAVLGLQSSRRARPRRHSRVHARPAAQRIGKLAQAYAFPPGEGGAGQTIGLIEFGGGFRTSDIEQFCARMGVVPPRITVVRIGGGANRPASPAAIHKFLDVVSGAQAPPEHAEQAEESDSLENAQCTVEVTMDLEILAALAPRAHIVVYFASSDEQGLYHAINRAVHDERRRPGILSISWSMPETTIPKPEMQAIEGVLREAAQLGITVCASTGDAGALNGSTDGKPSVNFPASSPHCLACGGTSRKRDAHGRPIEVVWNATHHGIPGASGGGVSAHLPLPPWQAQARVPASPEGFKGRGLPDVAALADPDYGCEMWIAGRAFASAGTSAVAPLWAALVARLNQALGRRCGHIQPLLYQLGARLQMGAGRGRRAAAAAGLRAVTRGNNGFYRAGKGWSACAGYGSPRGRELLTHLQAWVREAWVREARVQAEPSLSPAPHPARTRASLRNPQRTSKKG